MNIIIPILGNGSRFAEYPEYKCFNKINGMTMIERVVMPFKKKFNIYIFCKHKHQQKLDKIFGGSNIKIIPLDETIGAAETIYKGVDYIPEKESFVTVDCDTICDYEITKKIKENYGINVVYTFYDNQKTGLYSYIKKELNKIIDIVEKKPISNVCCSGVYQFKSVKEYKNIYEETNKNNSEFYLSKIIKSYTKKHSFYIEPVDGLFDCVGTPVQLINYTKKHQKKITVLIDLDKTLIYDTNNNPEPIEKNVEYINYMYNNGHTIKIFTSRGMLSCKGDIKKIEKKYRTKITNILDKIGCKYHELIFGKPYADIYIDDKGVTAANDLFLSTGFYKKKNKTRSFNNVQETNDGLILKTGATAKNEIFFYQNTPKKINKFFPKIISTDNGILMEKINKPTYESLILKREIDNHHLDFLNRGINEIHSYTHNNNDKQIDVDWYYYGKLRERYNNNKLFYESLNITEFEIEKYKNIKSFNVLCVIHGDPVFSNIFLGDKNIILIDPRGKNKNNKSIYGPKCYDYMKIIQSLYGYDFVINNEPIPYDYLQKIRNYFIQKNESLVSEYALKIKCNLLSILPLHKDCPDRIYRILDFIKKIC